MDSPIRLAYLEELQKGKNLLGFSAGVDSTALFFLLLERKIPFDIALFNYQTRAQSNEEEAYARELAARYGKRCFVASLALPRANFEHRARLERYTFFERVIAQEGYERLLLAHHLGDRLEWLLMRLAQGSALGTLLGFSLKEQRKGYEIVRPLGEVDKAILYDYLHERKIRYFEDVSNRDSRHFRNRIRPLSEALLRESARGIRSSFRFLKEERERLYGEDIRTQIGLLFYFPKQQENARNLHFIDLSLKSLGYVMSQKQRAELLRCQFSSILADKFAIDCNPNQIFIAPFSRVQIPKKERERMRKARIPAKVRPYCASLDWADFWLAGRASV